MKSTYYLVLAAVVAAAGVTVYARLPDGDKPAPSVPLSADASAARRLELPPVALPPDDVPPDPMLIAPRGANLPLPLPVPLGAPELPPVAPVAGALPPLPLPSVPAMPSVPAVPEVPKPVAPPALPVPPVPPVTPEAPALPKVDLPALPVPPVLPVPPAPKPDPIPLPYPAVPAVTPRDPLPPMPPVPPAPKPEVQLPSVAPAPLLPVTKPEVALPPAVPPMPKPEVALPPAVPPMPVQPPAPKPDTNLLPPVTPAPLPKPEALLPPVPVQPPAPKPEAPLPPLVKPEPPAPIQPQPQPLPPRIETPAPAPSAPSASIDPKPIPLPPPVQTQPVLGPPPGTKFVLLKNDRLIECSSAAPNGDVWVVRQGALDRALPKGEVQFVGDSRDAIYKFVLARVKPADSAARLQVARWCMYVGMREQALAEAHEVRKLDPKSRTAADMIRSLELSLKQFPPADAPKMMSPLQPVYPVDLRPAIPPMAAPAVPVEPAPVAPPIPPASEPDLDVPTAAARAFPGLAMAVLQQKCAECHARADHAGSFKLARVDLENPSERAVRANLRATAAQLSADGAHPLLEKARTVHGDMKKPAMSHLDASYKALSAWAASARVAVVKPIPPAAPELIPPTGTAAPTAPALPPAVPVSKPVTDPLLPPLPPPGEFGAALPPKPPVAPGTGDEFDPAGYNRDLPPK